MATHFRSNARDERVKSPVPGDESVARYTAYDAHVTIGDEQGRPLTLVGDGKKLEKLLKDCGIALADKIAIAEKPSDSEELEKWERKFSVFEVAVPVGTKVLVSATLNVRFWVPAE